MTAALAVVALMQVAPGADVHLRQALLYLDNDRPALALEFVEKALALRPDYPRIRFFKGVALLKLGRFADSVAEFGAHLKAASSDAEALYYRGMAHAARQDFSSAEKDLRAARKLSPDSPGVLLQLGKLLLDTARGAEAVPLLRRRVELDPGHAPARYLLGRALQAAGRKEEADREFSAARRIQEQQRTRAIRDLAAVPR